MSLVFTEAYAFNQQICQGKAVYNLSSYVEGVERINILPNFQMDYSNKQFDMAYAEYLMKENHIFMELMKIVMNMYFGLDVVILITRDQGGLFDCITESLEKFLQQRYGIVSNNIGEIDDWNYIQDTDFSLQGLYNLDIDKERYSRLYVSGLSQDTLYNIIAQE